MLPFALYCTGLLTAALPASALNSGASHNGSHSSIAIANEGINTQSALILPRDQDIAPGEPEPDICQDASPPADAGVRGLNHGAQVVPTLTPPEASVSLSLTTVTSTSTHVVWITENANTPEATPAGVAPSVPAVPAPITTESSLTFPFYTASEYSPPWSCMTAPEVTYIQKTVTLTLPAPETATATTTVTATEAIENVVTSYVTEYLTQTQTQTGAPPTVTATETVTRDVTAVNEVTVTVNQTVIVTATATSNATVTVTGAPITVTSVSVSIGSSSVASTSSSKFTPTVPFASYSVPIYTGNTGSSTPSTTASTTESAVTSTLGTSALVSATATQSTTPGAKASTTTATVTSTAAVVTPTPPYCDENLRNVSLKFDDLPRLPAGHPTSPIPTPYNHFYFSRGWTYGKASTFNQFPASSGNFIAAYNPPSTAGPAPGVISINPNDTLASRGFSAQSLRFGCNTTDVNDVCRVLITGLPLDPHADGQVIEVDVEPCMWAAGCALAPVEFGEGTFHGLRELRIEAMVGDKGVGWFVDDVRLVLEGECGRENEEKGKRGSVVRRSWGSFGW